MASSTILNKIMSLTYTVCNFLVVLAFGATKVVCAYMASPVQVINSSMILLKRNLGGLIYMVKVITTMILLLSINIL